MIFRKNIRLKGKTDKIDALSLARYGQERQSEIIPEQELSESEEHLKELQARRKDLVSMRTKEKNRKASPSRTHVIKSEYPLLKITPKEIDKIDREN